MNEVRSPGRASLTGRVLATYAAVSVVLIAGFGFLTLAAVESVLRDQASSSLVRQARAVQLHLDETPSDALPPAVSGIAATLDVRVTVVAVDGTVLADSHQQASAMSNHADRPEVIDALSGVVGQRTRVSDTTGDSRIYVALPPVGDRIYRLSITERQFGDELAEVASMVGLAALIAAAVGVGVMAVVAGRLVRPIRDLTGVSQQVAEGRLDARARRSSIRELDRLGVSIGRIATELGNRIVASETEREILEALLDALPQGVILVAPDDSILYGNGTARDIVGQMPARLNQLTPRVLQRLVREAMTGEVQDHVVEPSGAGPTLRALASPLPDGRVLVVMTDISERVRIEAMRRDFVADASHELKTPIASILAASETLQMAFDRDPERARRFAALVHDAALQLARIVGDLLDLSRVESSSGGEALVRLDRVIEEEVDRLRPQAAEEHIVLSADVTPVTVRGTAADLGLAVRNLVSNAIRYSGEGDRVNVSLVREDGNVRVSVADTGVGIPRRSLNRVFERFYRVDVARSRETGGTGLGLAIVKHITEAHGGTVAVESELGFGSTFHLVLPVASGQPSHAGD
jgi:two-component system, OmpR family, phosphate regulon sensor histidine kinase PhoR